MPLSPWEILLLLAVLLLLFGARRLPEIGRSLGTGIREFKDSLTGTSASESKQLEPPSSVEPSTRQPAPAATAPDEPKPTVESERQ